jgi:saccharopine dehydrogenase-like NADP-dependent oxidoreductase
MKTKQRVLILGASGMLGSMLVDSLSRSGQFEISGAARRASGLLDRFGEIFSDVRWHEFNYDLDRRTAPFESLGRFEWIINAVQGRETGTCDAGANAIAGVSLRRLSYFVSGITPMI